VAQALPPTARTVTQDATLTGGRCRIPMDPESPVLLLAPWAQARDQPRWPAWMAPALAQGNGRGSPSPRDAAPGLWASVAHDLAAPHALDVVHGQHERVTAVAAPLATQERAAQKAVTPARAPRERRPTHPHSAGDEPAKPCPARAPQDPMRLEHAAPALEAARRAPARRAAPREKGQARLRGLGPADPCVERERGGRRTGPRIAPEMPGPSAPMRPMAPPEGLSPSRLERIDTAERGVPTMPAPRECVSRYGRPQGAARALTPPGSCAMPAKLRPSSSLDRVAQTRSVSEGAPLRERAERLRAPWCAPGGVWSAWSPASPDQLRGEAQRLARVCQRSRAHGEGRHGSLSLRRHQRRGRDLPRKRACCTTVHNVFLTRPDGTTAAERFCGQPPRSLCAAIWESVELAPTPLSPPRSA